MYIPGSGPGNVQLVADVLFPDPSERGNQTFPVIIFVNSWGVPEFEYLLRAGKFAEEGYVCVEYATRGWWFSGGEIDVAGQWDRLDGTAVVDWIVDNRQEFGANTSAIAFAGISYGAGISLEMAGFDPRVTTAVAMSGWANLSRNLYYQHSTSLHTVDTLVGIANSSGHPSPGLLKMYQDLVTHTDITAAMAYGNQRGAALVLKNLNWRKTPIFMSNNYLDRIFYPQEMLTFFEELQGPKYFLNNCGGHAMAEGIGLTDIHNYIWSKASMWLNYWLKGEQNGITSENPIRFQNEGYLFDPVYQEFSSWPAPTSELQWTQYTLLARGSSATGSLIATNESDTMMKAGARRSSSLQGPDETIFFTSEPPFFDGEGKQDNHAAFEGVFPSFPLNASRRFSISYVAQPFTQDTRICGSPTLTVGLTASNASFQLYAFLFDVPADASLTGAIVSDATLTRWGNTDAPTETYGPMRFRTMCHNFVQGHSLAIGFVLFARRYAPANTEDSLSVTLRYGGASVVNIPTVVL